MVIGTLQVDLFFPEPQSLKEKRMILKSVLTRLRQKLNVAVSQLDGMDKWQRSVVAVVCVSTEAKETDRLLNQVLDFFDGEKQLQVVGQQREVL